MFSLQQSSSANLFVQIPSTTLPHQCHDLLLDDLLLDSSLFEGAISPGFNQVSSTTTTTQIINPPPNSSKSRKRNNAGVVTDNKIPFAGAELVDGDGKRIFADDENGAGLDNKKKRMVHREIERLRRQEMSKLYASLRSLLPIEFIKGKRSISDHMHQAVNYIKHKQENIKCLSLKREKLKKSTTVTDNNNVALNGPSSNFNHWSMTASTMDITELDDHRVLRNRVVVDACHDGSTTGFEITINVDTRSRACHGGSASSTSFSLSRVLNVISQQGLNVTNCTSTRVNERLHLYSIQSEASGHDQDLTGIEHHAYELQQKLSDVVNMW